MKIGQQIIMDRAIATFSAQQSLVDHWVWDEKSLSEYDFEIRSCQRQVEKVSRMAAEVTAHIGLLDAKLALLHEWTVDALTMARVRFRRDPVAVVLLKGLSANSHSRSETMAEAVEFLSLWQSVGPTWSPMEEITLATFSAFYAECKQLLEDYSDKRAELRGEENNLNLLMESLHDLNIAWYTCATTIFRKGSPAGEMIRGTIPTTTPQKPATDLVLAPALKAAQLSDSSSVNQKISSGHDEALRQVKQPLFIPDTPGVLPKARTAFGPRTQRAANP